jgi:parallel beta-helix repeat protein
MRQLILLGLMAFSATFSFAQQTFYVALNGNNSAPGTLAQPFRTIYRASQFAMPGDTVYVRQGKYRNADFADGDIWEGSAAGRIECHGAPGQYITFAPYPSEADTFEFDGNYGVLIANSSYVIFKGFVIQGVSANITQQEALNNWGLYHLPTDPANVFHDITGNDHLLPLPAGTTKPSYYNGRGLVANESHHIILEKNEVYNCPSSGIRIEQCDYATVRNNKVHDNTFWTTQGVGAITMAESNHIDLIDTSKILVELNLVYNNENRMISWNPSKSFITYHIDEGAGIFMTRNSATYLHGGFKIANNIIYNCGTGGVICHFTNNALITHNSLYYNGTTGTGSSGGIGVNTTSDVTIANNIIYARPTKWAIGTLSSSNPNLTVSQNIVFNDNGVQVNNVISTGFTHADPLFVNPAAFDFHLQGGSPAINNADPLYATATDFGGNARLIPDIGAIEHPTILDATEVPFHYTEAETLPTDFFAAYPNPIRNEKLYVQIGDKDHFDLYDAAGRLVRSCPLHAGLNEIDLAVEPGIYLIRTRRVSQRLCIIHGN